MVKSVGGTLFGAINLQRGDASYLHTQLYIALREFILGGVVKSEQRLPSSRVLADELNISRTTVLTVYDRLTTEGLVYSKTGAGSFVSPSLKQRRAAMDSAIAKRPSSPQDAPQLSESFRETSERLPIRVEMSSIQAFSTAIPAVDIFPMPLWSRLVSRYSRQPDLVRYISSKGYPPLRSAIASHLRTERGLSCRPEQVFITSGAQQALSFLGEILLNPGDAVWCENPGSRVALNGFSASGAKLVPVPVDDEGLIVEQGLLAEPHFKLASVTPSHQQPRGSIMSLSRRLELLNAADEANAWIVEDDFDGEFFYSKRPLPTLFSIARNNRVIYVGTFSKSMFPSLRLGYFVVPEGLVDRLTNTVGSYLPAVPLLIQAATAEFIDKGHFATHIRKAKRSYRERYQALADSIQRHLSDYLELIPTETGFHALALFLKDHDERVIAEAAFKKDILIRPLSNYCIEDVEGSKGIVIGYGCVTPEEIEASVIVLRAVFESVKLQN
ncbi:MAG: GntR family transcriptional regulator/MocR family aminotransferase [Saprospiraceae bacterium]|jgi:GntR family transcriptional regulator/MocR family aminotransferase